MTQLVLSVKTNIIFFRDYKTGLVVGYVTLRESSHQRQKRATPAELQLVNITAQQRRTPLTCTLHASFFLVIQLAERQIIVPT